MDNNFFITGADKKKITILVPCFNEVENVQGLYDEIKKIIGCFPKYDFEFLFMDNSSTDGTDVLLKKIASNDKAVKVIINTRNFGWLRSPYYGLLQSKADAVVSMAADFQDPPQLISEFIRKWEEGNKLVLGVRNKIQQTGLMVYVRKMYYYLIRKISDVEQINNFTGFALYDKEFIDILRNIDEPYPYLRGLICEFGLKRAEVYFTQPVRKNGKSKTNFYALYDVAMNGFVNHSKLPLRLASFIGFSASLISFALGVAYLVYKLLFWNRFEMGLAPIIIGLFFFASVQLFFIGVIGEYVGAIYTQVKKRPLIIEKERINFD